MNNSTEGTKHTPGPWTLADDHSVAFPDSVFVLKAVNPADARLISRAPDLLGMVKDARRWIASLPPDYSEGTIMLDKLDEVIAKAEGR